MEIEKLKKQEVDRAILLLHNNARNISKAKSSNDKVGQSPQQDGLYYDDIEEVDLSYIKKYKQWFIKVFYSSSKKSYRFDIDSSDLQDWICFIYSLAKQNNSFRD